VDHLSKEGDGIAMTIWCGGKKLHSPVVESARRPFGPLMGQVKKGQTVDIVVSPRESSSFDSFSFRVMLTLINAEQTLETNSEKHFSGPYDSRPPKPLDRLEQLAQTLLMSNEFAFVD
jgi:hypothetical protein